MATEARKERPAHGSTAWGGAETRGGMTVPPHTQGGNEGKRGQRDGCFCGGSECELTSWWRAACRVLQVIQSQAVCIVEKLLDLVGAWWEEERARGLGHVAGKQGTGF
eukprot:6319921-Pyramimonas_sp.AAC.1